MKCTLSIIATAAIVAAIMMPGPQDLEQRQYCEMVALHHETNGQHGWPDYNGNFYEVCTHAQL